MKLKIRTFLAIVATATITNIAYSQTPYDDFAPSETKKEMLKLPETVFRAENSDTASLIRYVELDKEKNSISYFDINDSLLYTYNLTLTDKKWISVDPLAQKYP